MSGRPDILFPLFASLTNLPGVGPKGEKSFAQMAIEKPRDLLFTLPYSVIDRRPVDSLTQVRPGDVATVVVEVLAHVPPRSRGRPYRVQVRDAETTFQVVFFHGNAGYLEKQLPVGERRLISGKTEVFDSILQMVHPDHILPADAAGELPAYEPVYPLTAGITLKQMTKAAGAAVELAPDLEEWIDAALMGREGWPDWHSAIAAAHRPEGLGDLAATTPARQRLAYDEFFAHQLTLALARQAVRRGAGKPTSGNGAYRARVMAALPYRPTDAQTRAMEEIETDMARPRRMNRLLQGDVGSGKTLVAFLSLLIAVEGGGQGVLMAPTEILARQHMETLRPLAEEAGVVLELLTGRHSTAERNARLRALAAGNIHILVGTHAVFQKGVEFKDLRLAVIDEQHRFGVAQRMELSQKGQGAHVLVMTATPIPRSLSLAQYGDMDVSVLDEKPPGRTPVKTALVSTGRMEEVLNHLQQAIADGKQAYWVCPLVEESEKLDLTAAEERFKILRARFGEGRVGLVHGQMPGPDKDAAMARFVAGETSVLVATTVIEVGVNVPNASIMVIERAEGFGLAQLHQLRGRVGRGDVQSTCLLMYEPPLTETGRRRLEILRETEDGFRIAEEDLAMRGAGDVIGTAQSGLPKFRIADMETQTALMGVAQADARKLLHDDPDLTGPRGQAARVLLWLMEQDKSIRLISVG